MKLEKHIAALLYRYQCVTVPGFGAFLTEIRAAYADAGTNTFYPPKKLISFNANLKNNDGLLANHIALEEKISYGQAVENILREVEEWLYNLETGKSLQLKDLGDIALNNEKSIVFTPNTPINYLTDAFGLGMVVSPAIKREELKAIVEELEETAPIAFTPERRRNYSYLKYASVIIVALFAGTAGFKVYHDNQAVKQTLLIEQAVQEKVQQRIQEATFFIDNPLPAVAISVKGDTPKILPYHVVAGAFRSEANADNAVNQLVAKGYKARKLEKNKFGLYPVLYGSFATHSEAYKNMIGIRRTNDKEAWLLIKEL
jgi:hypothetical protein